MQLIKILKIALGSTIAICIAYALHLNYAVSAGIITLLTLQDTKKETIWISAKRAFAFFFAFALAYLTFFVFSYTAIAFGIFLAFFIGLCIVFKVEEAIAMNAVLATHYLLDKNMGFSMFTNELLLFVIGAGIGILLNLYIPNNVNRIIEKQRIIEESIKGVLLEMSAEILEDKKRKRTAPIMDLEKHISYGMEQAYQNMNNSFFQETRYYISYMEMRNQQYLILNEIWDKIQKLNMVTSQAKEISAFIEKIANNLSEYQNTNELFQMQETLMDHFKQSELPVTRQEFENRAIMYMILVDFRMFLRLKRDFVAQLSDLQKKQYWSKEKRTLSK